MAPYMKTTAQQLDGRKGGPATMSDAVRAGPPTCLPPCPLVGRAQSGVPGGETADGGFARSDLRQSHFDVGTYKTDWISMAKTDFSRPVNPKTADLPVETMNDLRNPHFHYGFDKANYLTTSRAEHGISNSCVR